MASSRVKRQFAGASADPSQRQITSFFTPSDCSSTPNSRDLHLQSTQPVLPPSVQSNLLSVGMRVRKSVPEGYKTQGHSVFKLWTDNTIPGAHLASSGATTAARELLPFCAIHNVGAFGTQSLPPDAEGDNSVPGLDEVPGLTLSQESVSSNEHRSSRKHLLVEDEDSNDGLIASYRTDAQAEARSKASGRWPEAGIMSLGPTHLAKQTYSRVDDAQSSVDVVEDFEEADFLVVNENDAMDATV